MIADWVRFLDRIRFLTCGLLLTKPWAIDSWGYGGDSTVYRCLVFVAKLARGLLHKSPGV